MTILGLPIILHEQLFMLELLFPGELLSDFTVVATAGVPLMNYV